MKCALALKRMLRCVLVFAVVGTLAAKAADTPLKLSEVPPKPERAIRAQLGDGKLSQITRSSEGCEIRYDVEMTKEGRDRSFAVNGEGDLIESQVFMRELPRPVQRAIHAHIGKGAPDSILKANEDGEVNYDVEFTKDGKERDFTLDNKGELVQERMYLDELPESVRPAVQKQATSSTIAEIYRIIDQGESYYEVELGANGKTRSVGFNGKGDIAYQEETVSFAEVPEAARNAAKAKLGNATPCDVTKHTEDDEVSYEIDFKKDGKRQSVTVSSDGK
jgi:uncharacterized membrane protein YkoI